MPNRVRNATNFVKKHRVLIAVAATTVVLTTVHIKIVGNWNEFLAEHDLMDVYYLVED